MSRLLAILACVVLLLACSATASGDDDGPGSDFTHIMPDGQTVQCLYYRGLSCNWEDAR